MLNLNKALDMINPIQFNKFPDGRKVKSVLRPTLIGLGLSLISVTAYSQDWVPVTTVRPILPTRPTPIS